MGPTVVSLNGYREEKRAAARPYASMDDLPDVTPDVQDFIKEMILATEPTPVVERSDSQWTPRLVDL